MAAPGSAGAKREGFALIVTVSLLALLVLVLVALAALTRVETAIGQNSQRYAQARQNALFALNQAIGELQFHAGPDARVTARADILAAGIANPMWTGAWDRNQGTARTWLVSGNENAITDDSTPPPYGPGLAVTSDGASTAITLVGKQTVGTLPASYVVAPLVELTGTAPDGTTGVPLGRYAWWVGDEGVKARVNLQDPYTRAAAGSIDSHFRITAAQRVGIEHVALSDSNPEGNQLNTDYPANPQNATEEALSKVLSLSQLPFAKPAAAANLRTATRVRFHDLTTYSVGLLTDAANGGLKKDLNHVLADTTLAGYGDSDAIPLSGFAGPISNPTWGSLRGFYSERADTSSPGLTPNANVHPIIVAFTVWVGITPGSAPLLFRPTITPIVVLANPYDFDIAGADYVVEIEGRDVPSGEVDYTTVTYTDGAVGLLTDSLPGLMRPRVDPNVDTPVGVRLPAADSGFAPGAVRIYSLSAGDHDPDGNPEFKPGNASGYLIGNATGLGSLPAVTTVYFDLGDMHFRLKLNGQTIQDVNDVHVATDPNPKATVALSALATAQPKISGRTFHIRAATGLAMASGNTDATYGQTQWIAQHAFRATFTKRMEAIWANDTVWRQNPLWELKVLKTGDTAFEPPSPPRWGLSYMADTGDDLAVLFHVLREEPVSLGQFQHASFSVSDPEGGRVPTYAIGNSYASPYVAPQNKDLSYALNEVLWDSYFCSGFSGITWPNPAAMRNRRLRGIGVTTGSSLPTSDAYRKLAANLVVEGPFNVNSTSVEAWMAQLSSFNGNLDEAILDPSGTGIVFENTFLRTPYPVAPSSPPNDFVGTRRGVRQILDVPARDLATKIVDQVRLRGPFKSLAEFVNRHLANSPTDPLVQKGALQLALDIAETPGSPPVKIQPVWSSAQNIPAPSAAFPFREAAQGTIGTNLTGWISQADVLTALGPTLTVRSDTFLVRTYGETINPVTQAVEGRAWCEAVVQRLPEYVYPNANTPDTIPNPLSSSQAERDNATFGRRFVITSFRWLSPSDI